MKDRKEDYRILVSILTVESPIDDVLCKIYLPKRMAEPIEFYLYPNEAQKNRLKNLFEFSIIGEVRGFTNELEATIQADKVYFKTGSTTRWGKNIDEHLFIAEPVDLKISEFLPCNTNDLPNKTVGCFWLTHSRLLSPTKIIDRSYKGDVKVESIGQTKFALTNGLNLAFDNNFRHIENKDGDCITFTELVAEFETDAKMQVIENTELGCLDDFLMLVSFAERHRCVCLGWELGNTNAHTRFYRRNLVIPKLSEKRSILDTLIDIKDFEDFIKLTYCNFIQMEPKDLIRQVIQPTIHQEGKTLESSFLTFYAALETLALLFRRSNPNQLEFVLSPDQWSKFQKDLEKWLKNSSQFSNDKTKRALIYEKLPELNRISFSTAFNKFCNFYSVDLSDLWPIVENSEGISLSKIRNKLIHGEPFNPLQGRALIAAKEHLHWVLERLILAFLGWPISKSTVNKDYLARNMACYSELKKDQQILSNNV